MPKDDVTIPNDWDGETYACYSVMWPKSFLWRSVLNGLIDTAGGGWYYNSLSGNVVQAANAIKATWEYNFKNEEVVMACNDTTNEFLERMALALEGLLNKPCCSTGGSGIVNAGSRGAGISAQPPNGYNEDEVPPDTPPAGFDTWEEYRTHKCNVAHDIIKNLKIDLLSLSNLLPEDDTFTEILLALVAVILTPIPYDDLAALVGLLTVAAIEYSFLASLSALIQENAQSLICQLYSAPDSETAKNNTIQAINDIIDGMSIIDAGKEWLKNIVVHLLVTDSTNKLFTPGPTEEQEGNCTSCSGFYFGELYIPPGQTGVWGSLTIDGDHYTCSSEVGDDCNRLNIHVVDGSGNPGCLQITNIDVSGATHDTGFDFWHPCGGDIEACPGNNVENIGGECMHAIILCSNTPFTIEFDLVTCP